MSIYNTSHSRRAGAARSPNTQHTGAVPPRIIQRRPPPPRPQQQPINIPYNDFQLMSCKKRGKHHVMDFKTNKPVDFNNFARPVKLQRKDNNNHGFGRMHRMANGGNSTPNASQGSNSAAGNSQDASSSQQQQHQQHGPKTGADTSLIAPLGGATRNKQMLFKKRTKQIYLAKEDARELKEQEHKPWILEDYDGQNSYTGSYEGSQRSDYVFFVVSGNDFKVVPVDRWYKFQQKRNVATFTLEEAEEQLKNLQKREQSRWMMLNRNKAMEDAESQSQGSQGVKSRFKKTDHGDTFGGGSDDEGGSGRRDRHDSDIDDLDFDDVFQDDEEGGGEHEMEDEDTRESKERLKRETKGYAPGADEEAVETMDDDSNRLTSEGKQIRKLVRTLEKNGAYESDEDRDPYASSEEEMESDAEKEESKSEAESSQQKKTIVPPKKKGPAPSSKTATAKKSHASKIKKEGLSRPIGRPGSPSLQQGKASPPPAQRATSPIQQQRMREISPGATPVKKRKSDEGEHGTDAKRYKNTATSASTPTSAASPGGGDDSLITEDEVIQTLRGKKLTTKEFLMHFRKRIKKNEKNREIITGLLKKVARHNTSEQDPTKRVLELRPDLQ
ncbi:hypothetical protein LRAMOSA06469 [Lichtheimia ramosa]|uniref:Transcription initiation factor IIF subunit alpha n=1 Tax=Lichtheimia ramosa TaxID=688394 RepID=A0A077X488_9FUNG|nr:hypothetical protein LRAMOSA06469 [Lichtheimia ramosa]